LNWRAVAFAAAALCLLAVDVALFPDFVEDGFAREVLPAAELVQGGRVDLGKYHLHRLTVSHGRIGDASWTANVADGASAVAVSAFSASGAERIAIGPLTNALLATLPEAQATELVQLLQNSPTFSPGKVQVLALTPPRPPSAPTPRFVFLLRARRGADRDAKEALRTGIAELFRLTETRSVSRLWLPTLTVDPGEQDSPSFDDFFAYLFDALRTSTSPRHVDVSLFDQWSSPQLEAAVAAFNAHWTAATQARKGTTPRFYRFELRLLLGGLAMALVVSARHVTLGLKTACIVTIAYALMLLGSFKTIETLAHGLSDDVRVAGMVAMTLVAALGFPSIVQWSAKDLFGKAS
jgi:hypothetical protein